MNTSIETVAAGRSVAAGHTSENHVTHTTLTHFRKVEGIMRTIRTITLVTVAALCVVWSGTSHAQTVANTAVNNTATLNYQVNGNPMPETEATAQFVVDRKIDFTVATTNVAAAVDAAPGDTGKYLTFTVTNTGNATFDYNLSSANADANPFGLPAESFNATVTGVFVESSGAGYQVGVDTATYINDLAPGAPATVYIVANIPNTRVNDDVSSLDLVVQVAEASGTPGTDITTDDSGTADVPGTMEDVFADAAGTATGDALHDGKHSDDSAFQVSSADLTITKASTVISDPVTGELDSLAVPAIYPKAIPGAVIRYTVTVQNDAGAGAPATGIVVSDDLTTEITAGTIAYTALDKGDFDSAVIVGNIVTAEIALLAVGASASFTIDVTIQ